ncbi:hypothetical protein Acsp03_30500 [Actinomadura sp. NBRC 104412]|nr:hypothetical protein [Actinomadura sp. NBRC 104412]GLZ05584.1 hypothetical protein Acsp03_30500 [Actinomadura sp. NBRC 104412]
MSASLANPRRTRLDHWPVRVPAPERDEERDRERERDAAPREEDRRPEAA